MPRAFFIGVVTAADERSAGEQEHPRRRAWMRSTPLVGVNQLEAAPLAGGRRSITVGGNLRWKRRHQQGRKNQGAKEKERMSRR
jgi:hypothetical protein